MIKCFKESWHHATGLCQQGPLLVALAGPAARILHSVRDEKEFWEFVFDGCPRGSHLFVQTTGLTPVSRCICGAVSRNDLGA